MPAIEVQQIQVSNELTNLQNAIDLANKRLNVLEDRLSPILYSKPDKLGTPVENKIPKCKLAEEIAEFGDEVNHISRIIDRIITSLEI